MDNIFLINLDRSTDRLHEFNRVNPHMAHATRFPAVEGKTIPRAELLAQKIFEEPIFYTGGAIGNALSHLNVWRKASQAQAHSTVLEDDAIVHRDFETLAPSLISTLPADWDIVLWGWNFDTVMSYDIFTGTPCAVRFSQADLRKHWESIQKSAVKPSLHRLHYAFGTIGYSVSSAGAKKLAEMTVPIKPFLYRIPAFNMEIPNEAMDCVMASLYGRLNAYVSFPPLILTKNERASSTVQEAGAIANEKEHGLSLTPSHYSTSRKFRKKYARYLFKKGDILGGSLAYLKYLSTSKS